MRSTWLGSALLALGICSLVAHSLAAPAHAQGFDVARFKPVPNQQDNYFTLHSTHTLPAWRWEAGLVLDYANDPLVLVDRRGSRRVSLVGDQVTANVLGAIGLTDELEVGLALPVLLMQDGETFQQLGVPDAPNAGLGIGDLRIVGKLALLQQDTVESPGGFGLALALDLQLPTGSAADFQGEGFGLFPRAIVDYAFAKGTRLSAQAGYRVRPRSVLLRTEINDTIVFGVGADVPLDAQRVWHVLGEVSAEVSVLASDTLGKSETPLEAILGGRVFPGGGFMAEAGLGIGMNAGLGTPDYRLILAATYRSPPPPPDKDSDGDGLLDSRDACPMQPEDKDRFEDADGCVDPDDDKDGVLDVQDACRVVPEDKDAFEDADGCPDPDNDKDGLLDVNDGCPNQPEDTDGFEDADGCPDPDNDKDGLLDPDDACPEQAEDKDFFEDADGCPEPGAPRVKLTCDKIEIKDSVFFDTNSDRIQERSFKLLDEVVTVLEAATYITKLRVEGHTDSVGNDKKNLDLSKRRAASVRTYLVEHGVDAARLESDGFGESKAVADNKAAEGRAQNRRVDFMILEQSSACTE
jgi:large repetitive protein